MPSSARLWMACIVGCLVCAQVGCSGFPRRKQMRAAQYRSWQLWHQNQSLMQEQAGLQGQLSTLQASNDSMQKRLDNLQAERSELHNRYLGLINRTKTDGNPLSDKHTRDLEELKKRFPGFEFDPHTGVSKFGSDVLFDSGSAEIKPGALPILQEFAKILCDGDAQRLNILVVGHTDDKPIVKANTKREHHDNWELSTHRSLSVRRALHKSGIQDNRMGVAGYGEYQPLTPNTDENARKLNRRVEIFVLAPNASVAGWDNPNTTTQ
ncbi:MAG: OmpA family protein [Planctomycetales bacterium]